MKKKTSDSVASNKCEDKILNKLPLFVIEKTGITRTKINYNKYCL